MKKRRYLFPRAKDYHKPGFPEVPNGLGAVYVIVSAVYLFTLHILNVEGALALAGCVLFSGFLGLFDDWADLRWRYKAILPVFASIPLIALRQGETKMATYIFGKIDFGIYYYLVIAPAITTITTNAVNQLGGLNGLETICPLIVMLGLMAVSPKSRVLLVIPSLTLAILAYYNYKGKIFVGNVGTFSEGTTLAAYAIIANIEQTLVISIIPYIVNSSLIILNYVIWRRKPSLKFDGEKLTSTHRRSIQTLIAYRRKLTEGEIVNIITLMFIITTLTAVLISFIS